MSLKRGVLNTAVMVLLAVAVFYSARYWPQRIPLLPAAKVEARSKAPDYTITAFHAVDLDEAGHLRYELAAERLVHFPEPDHALLDAPDVVFYRNTPAVEANGEPWQLTADSGVITDSGKRLDLSGNVKVARLVEDTIGRMTMDAPQLTVLGDREFASTDGPVTLHSDQAELTAVGMKIDMKKGQLQLLSQVRGRYEPM